jgi:predicted amidophosphoribosyltransferase
MFCQNCGAEIKEPNQKFCQNCGSEIPITSGTPVEYPSQSEPIVGGLFDINRTYYILKERS